MKQTLRSYQIDQLDAVANALRDGNNRVVIKSPTGTGKSTTLAALLEHPPLKAWLSQFPENDRKMMVIAHREELLDQSAERIRMMNPGLMVMVEQGDRMASVYADVIVASIQTLAAVKFRRLKRLVARITPRIVVVDECHHAPSATYRTALAHLGFLPLSDISDKDNIEAATHDDVEVMTQALAGWDLVAPKDRLLVGVTATPNRSDAVGLGCVFQTIAYSYALRQAIADEWLVPIVSWSIETRTSLDDVRLNRGDFNQRELADTVNTPQRNAIAVSAWREHAERVPTLGFTVDVAHAHDLAAAFVAEGYRWAAVSGETPKEDRRLLLRQFNEGQLDGLANCLLYTEGTDIPRVGCVLMAKPTKSATLLEQCIGRGLRLFPGKDHCVVIDLVDVARRHSLQTAPVLYGLPPGVLTKGKDLQTASDEFEELISNGFDAEQALQGKHLTLEQLGALAKQVDIWNVPSLGDFGNGRALEWMKFGEDRYRLQYPWGDGTEVLEVSQDLVGRWELVVTMQPANHGPKRQRTIATQIVSATAAAEVGEGFIMQERQSVMKLKANDAPWKKRPATPKQLGLLQRLKVPHIPKNCTMGQASQLIDLAMARKGR